METTTTNQIHKENLKHHFQSLDCKGSKIIQNHHTARSSMIFPADDLHRQSHRHDVVLLTCGLGACASSAQWHQSLALALASTSTSASTDILQSLAVTACVQLLGFLGWMLGSLRQIFIVL